MNNEQKVFVELVAILTTPGNSDEKLLTKKISHSNMDIYNTALSIIMYIVLNSVSSMKSYTSSFEIFRATLTNLSRD